MIVCIILYIISFYNFYLAKKLFKEARELQLQHLRLIKKK